VPVCDGDPNFLDIANVDKPIYLFRRADPLVPSALTPMFQQIANWFFNLTSDRAFATDFDVTPVHNSASNPMDIQNHVPGRQQWQKAGVGAFVGFPGITRAQTPLDLSLALFYLHQMYFKIQSR
jgi:hypothetical protein